jgi:hypothetical protein
MRATACFDGLAGAGALDFLGIVRHKKTVGWDGLIEGVWGHADPGSGP